MGFFGAIGGDVTATIKTDNTYADDVIAWSSSTTETQTMQITVTRNNLSSVNFNITVTVSSAAPDTVLEHKIRQGTNQTGTIIASGSTTSNETITLTGTDNNPTSPQTYEITVVQTAGTTGDFLDIGYSVEVTA